MDSTDSSRPGVDADGRPVKDPTANVLDLVNAAIRRQDDLRESESRHQEEMRIVQERHAEQLRDKETQRIDAIRAVDVQAVQRAAEVQQTQAGALANQVVATADAFRVSLAAALEPIIKDIADLRKTQYEQAGQKAQTIESGTGSRSWIGIAIGAAAVMSSFFIGAAGIVITLMLR